jgi:uncharacterized membrane protein
VKDDLVMAEVVEFELLQGGHNLFTVVSFMENAEREHEQRVLGVNLAHAVIPTLINVDNVFAEWSCHRIG